MDAETEHKRQLLAFAEVVDRLHRSAEGAVRGLEEAPSLLMRTLEERASDVIERTAQVALQRSLAQMSAATQAAAWAAEALAEQRRLLTRAQRHFVVAGSAALLLASLLVSATAWYWIGQSRAEVDRNHADATLLRLVNGADLRTCGARLCANVEGGSALHDGPAHYRPVRLRSPSDTP